MSTSIAEVETTPDTAGEHYERLEKLRREQREELGARLREQRSAIAPAATVDVNDTEAISGSCSSTEIWAATVEITARTLQSIEHALERLRSGSYGVCSDCGAQISSARLRAMPFAERCRPCQQLADAERMVLAA